MALASYVVLDSNHLVVTGPVLWDGVTTYDVTPNTLHLLPTPPPAFKVGDTYDPNTDIVTPRTLTPTETAMQNAQTLIGKATSAFTSNATFLALASPTSPQVLAQVQALTKQVNAALKLLANQTQDTTNT